MSDVTNYDGRLEAMANYSKSMYENIAKVNNAYSDQTEECYTKALPSKYMDLLSIKKIGGKTIVWNQLANFSPTSTVVNDITWTLNADGTVTAVGTASAASFVNVSAFLTVPVNHTFLIRGCPAGGDTGKYFIYDGYSTSVISGDVGSGKIYNRGNLTNFVLRCNVVAGQEVDITFTPQAYDLTLMFGAGNEPSTVAEFEKMFPEVRYPYEKNSLLSSGVKSIVSKDSTDVTLETYSIPEEITTMEGYGWSCPGANNYIDFDTKQFVQAVGSRPYEAGDESDSTVITDGTNTHYELDEPLAFDVDLPDKTITKAVAGGSITFENQHEGDYNIPVPVELEYIGVA